jgi:hypothetical protein
VCGESRMHGDNGGDEETDREVPRLVPTRCGRGTAVRCSLVAQVAADGGTAPAAERGALGEQPTRLRILRGESPLPSIARFGRLAYPTWRKVTTSAVLGRISHGGPTALAVAVGAIWVASKSGGLNISE